MNQSHNIAKSEVGGTIARRLTGENDLTEIKHPLSAIVANADAARRWLSRPDPNFHEAIAALKRIVKESTRINEAIAGVQAMAAGEGPDTHLA